jgi:hypothetical protein
MSVRPSFFADCVAIVLVLGSLGGAGCGGSNAPSAPTLPPASPPVAQPTGLQPTVTSVSPNVVSTSGSWGTITGTDFQPGATVKFGSAPFSTLFVDNTTLRFASSGAHAAGTVDVTVTNPGGFAATLPGGYAYALPSAFEFNGDWIAHAGPDYEIGMRFTIRNNVLVWLSCGTDASLTMPTPLSVLDGSFSFSGADGLAVSGTLASGETSSGRINAPGCSDARWWADKLPDTTYE